MSGPEQPRRGRRFPRTGDGLEFERVAFFTDAVFAIAMTLLVVGIAVPAIAHPNSSASLLRALNDKMPEFVAFFIGFALLGFYWTAHHRFFALLGSVDGPFVAINLLYLAFIAVLPFPTSLIGTYDGNPVAVCIFAGNAAIVSGCEVMLLRRAQHVGLLRRPLPEPVYRHACRGSLLPVLFFVTSLPLAFVDTYVAMGWWALIIPSENVLDRFKPSEYDAYLA